MYVLGQDRRDAIGSKQGARADALVLILASAFLLLSSLYAAEASVFKKAREAALEAASPVLSVFAGPAAFVQARIGEVKHYFAVLEQNAALREEIAALRHWEREARELRRIIASIEALESYNGPPRAKGVIGVVVGETNDAYVHSMIVNAGARDGVAEGQAVMDERGLVGRIVETSRNAARVLLLNDVQSRVPVFVEGAEVEGILVGRTTDRPAIAFTRAGGFDRVKPGQRIATSGAGGVLPRGLPVGVVSDIVDDEALVDLDANYAMTRIVRVLDYRFPDLEDALAGDEDDVLDAPAASSAAPSPGAAVATNASET
ncbi:MAG: rod shape-determining protein MreC [Parvularculaceae bacterium]